MFGSYRTIVLTLGIALIVFFFLMPEYQKVKEINANISEYSDTLANINDFNLIVQKKTAELDATSAEDLTKLDRMVQMGGIEVSQILYDLEALAGKVGMTVEDMQIYMIQQSRDDELSNAQNTVSVSDFYTQDTLVKLSGSYSSFKQFVSAVEKSITPFEIVSVKFVSEGNAVAQFEVRIRTWSLIPRTSFK